MLRANNINVLIITVFLIIISCGESGPSAIKINEEKGTLIGGSMAYDGISIWANSLTKGLKSGGEKKIIKINRDGDIVKSFEPDENISGDMAFDGTNLFTGHAFGWETEREYSDHGAIYSVNPETEELMIKFTISEYYNELEGLAASPGTLWAMVMKRNDDGVRNLILYEIDTRTESITNNFKFTELRNCTGITYANGYIFALTGTFHKKVMKIKLSDGNIEKEFDFQGRVINGITSMDNCVYLFDEEKDILFRL